MAIEKPAPWMGASGSEYTFYVFGLDPDVPSRLGNFIYAKRNAEGAWVPIYMGHGDLAACCTDPDVLRCISEKSATHLHLRLNSREADRTSELQDLLAHYANAFAPEGCHRTVEPTRGAAASGGPTAGRQALPKPTGRQKATVKSPPKKTVKTPGAGKAAAKTATTRKAAAKKPAAIKSKSPRPRAK